MVFPLTDSIFLCLFSHAQPSPPLIHLTSSSSTFPVYSSTIPLTNLTLIHFKNLIFVVYSSVSSSVIHLYLPLITYPLYSTLFYLPVYPIHFFPTLFHLLFFSIHFFPLYSTLFHFFLIHFIPLNSIYFFSYPLFTTFFHFIPPTFLSYPLFSHSIPPTFLSYQFFLLYSSLFHLLFSYPFFPLYSTYFSFLSTFFHFISPNFLATLICFYHLFLASPLISTYFSFHLNPSTLSSLPPPPPLPLTSTETPGTPLHLPSTLL